jgi:hypothetical protein
MQEAPTPNTSNVRDSRIMQITSLLSQAIEEAEHD